MAVYTFGDILIINFPYSDGASSKRRPVMVVKDTEDGDIIVAKITSKIYNTSYDQEIINWSYENLVGNSIVRLHKPQTIYANLIFGKIGVLHPSDKRLVKNCFASMILNI